MEITAAMVKELRERTGAGMMDCKKALKETDGNMDKAIDFLREKGLAAAAKKEGRIAAEGIVDSYIHMGGTVGVLVEVNCETDFVAKTDEFKELVHDIALQIAAAAPEFVDRAEVPTANLEHEKEILRAQALNEGKPEKIVDRMVEGRVEKYYKEVCLLEQPFVKNPDVTIQQMITEKIAKIGEKITVRRFTRYKMGEGLEKRVNDLAAEVAAQTGAAK
ncbi:MAG TPA: translation elongation factor Ts [Candidatus Faecaligallichristensenella faecipullorum]|nr:translation elongation factor Ts [Candidatus Faecaligallichristensenella faecipullorum]